MFKKIKLILSASLLLLFVNMTNSYGQVIEEIPQLHKDFQVVMHFVHREGTRAAGVTEAGASAVVTSINPYFSPIDVSFSVCETYEIENYQYEINSFEKRKEVLIKYGLRKKINIFLVEQSLIADGDADEGAIILDQQGLGGIFITYDSFDTGILAHEMGHFFGLKHTFEGSNELNSNRELVDGSNCETTGDMVCDTPADPYKENNNSQTDYSGQGCVYTGTPDSQLKDLNGDFYTPDLGNIMSYYVGCPHGKGFTDGQYRRIVEIYLQNPHRW